VGQSDGYSAISGIPFLLARRNHTYHDHFRDESVHVTSAIMTLMRPMRIDDDIQALIAKRTEVCGNLSETYDYDAVVCERYFDALCECYPEQEDDVCSEEEEEEEEEEVDPLSDESGSGTTGRCIILLFTGILLSRFALWSADVVGVLLLSGRRTSDE